MARRNKETGQGYAHHCIIIFFCLIDAKSGGAGGGVKGDGGKHRTPTGKVQNTC
jgi:hypothetical protein